MQVKCESVNTNMFNYCLRYFLLPWQYEVENVTVVCENGAVENTAAG